MGLQLELHLEGEQWSFCPLASPPVGCSPRFWGPASSWPPTQPVLLISVSQAGPEPSLAAMKRSTPPPKAQGWPSGRGQGLQDSPLPPTAL